ncbi:hypothetical protein OG729_37290 [Streptomyces sp. NBC_00210]|uniref:hypothetical protein n=1 Tax=unclassified Streptomyces TaxID=2593676 RepID=UPI003254789E
MDQGGADAEEDLGGRPNAEGGADGDEGDRGGLQKHARGGYWFMAPCAVDADVECVGQATVSRAVKGFVAQAGEAGDLAGGQISVVAAVSGGVVARGFETGMVAGLDCAAYLRRARTMALEVPVLEFGCGPPLGDEANFGLAGVRQMAGAHRR